MNLSVIMGVTLVLNLGFGYFRAQVRKYSFPWFLYIHLPIPVVILMRMAWGYSYRSIPLLLTASILGQWGGGKILGITQKISRKT